MNQRRLRDRLPMWQQQSWCSYWEGRVSGWTKYAIGSAGRLSIVYPGYYVAVAVVSTVAAVVVLAVAVLLYRRCCKRRTEIDGYSVLEMQHNIPGTHSFYFLVTVHGWTCNGRGCRPPILFPVIDPTEIDGYRVVEMHNSVPGRSRVVRIAMTHSVVDRVTRCILVD